MHSLESNLPWTSSSIQQATIMASLNENNTQSSRENEEQLASAQRGVGTPSQITASNPFDLFFSTADYTAASTRQNAESDSDSLLIGGVSSSSLPIATEWTDLHLRSLQNDVRSEEKEEISDSALEVPSELGRRKTDYLGMSDSSLSITGEATVMYTCTDDIDALNAAAIRAALEEDNHILDFKRNNNGEAIRHEETAQNVVWNNINATQSPTQQHATIIEITNEGNVLYSFRPRAVSLETSNPDAEAELIGQQEYYPQSYRDDTRYRSVGFLESNSDASTRIVDIGDESAAAEAQVIDSAPLHKNCDQWIQQPAEAEILLEFNCNEDFNWFDRKRPALEKPVGVIETENGHLLRDLYGEVESFSATITCDDLQAEVLNVRDEVDIHPDDDSVENDFEAQAELVSSHALDYSSGFDSSQFASTKESISSLGVPVIGIISEEHPVSSSMHRKLSPRSTRLTLDIIDEEMPINSESNGHTQHMSYLSSVPSDARRKNCYGLDSITTNADDDDILLTYLNSSLSHEFGLPMRRSFAENYEINKQNAVPTDIFASDSTISRQIDSSVQYASASSIMGTEEAIVLESNFSEYNDVDVMNEALLRSIQEHEDYLFALKLSESQGDEIGRIDIDDLILDSSNIRTLSGIDEDIAHTATATASDYAIDSEACMVGHSNSQAAVEPVDHDGRDWICIDTGERVEPFVERTENKNSAFESDGDLEGENDYQRYAAANEVVLPNDSDSDWFDRKLPAVNTRFDSGVSRGMGALGNTSTEAEIVGIRDESDIHPSDDSSDIEVEVHAELATPDGVFDVSHTFNHTLNTSHMSTAQIEEAGIFGQEQVSQLEFASIDTFNTAVAHSIKQSPLSVEPPSNSLSNVNGTSTVNTAISLTHATCEENHQTDRVEQEYVTSHGANSNAKRNVASLSSYEASAIPVHAVPVAIQSFDEVCERTSVNDGQPLLQATVLVDTFAEPLNGFVGKKNVEREIDVLAGTVGTPQSEPTWMGTPVLGGVLPTTPIATPTSGHYSEDPWHSDNPENDSVAGLPQIPSHQEFSSGVQEGSFDRASSEDNLSASSQKLSWRNPRIHTVSEGCPLKL